MTDWKIIATILANALALKPCACTKRWVKDGTELKVMVQCSGCKAIELYTEALNREPKA